MFAASTTPTDSSRAARGRALDAAMDAFAAGDDAAFAIVDALSRRELAASLYRLAGNTAAAADLVQDTLIRVFRSRHRWRANARFLPWAYTIGRRLFFDRVRRERCRRRVYDAFAHREAMRTAIEPRDEHAARDAATRLATAYAGLGPAQRDVVDHVILGDESIADAARRLGEGRVAVRVRVCRARRELAAALEAA